LGCAGARRWRSLGALALLLVATQAGAQDGSASSPTSDATPPRTSKVGAGDVPASGLPGAVDPTHPVVEPPLSTPPTSVAAPSAAPMPPVDGAAISTEEHRHGGLYIHADVGGGYLRITGSRGGSDFAGHSGAVGLGLALGWAPNDEWALALEGWVWKSLSASGLGPETTVELQGLGLNVTRYIVPIDLFATVVVSGTRLAITEDDRSVEDAHSDIGLGLRIRVGKEWHVTPWLGLGVAAEFFLSLNREGGQSLDSLGGGLVFSCTGR